MLSFESHCAVTMCNGLSRRDFLRVGGLTAAGMSLTLPKLEGVAAASRQSARSCILLFLVGGPSQLETWDPKPDAPSAVRGPFQAIRTAVPGVCISEHLPRLASLAREYCLIRSLYHDEAAIHETGQQLIQTGRLCTGDIEPPHCGAVVSRLRGPAATGTPAFAIVPGPIGNTGVQISHGQTAGYLGSDHEPELMQFEAIGSDPLARVNVPDASLSAGLTQAVDEAQRSLDATAGESEPVSSVAGYLFGSRAKRAYDLSLEPDSLRDAYGRSTFGQSCLLARRLVEHGVRLVTVNMFDTVYDRITWDCHADGGSLASTLGDYRRILCPMLDQALSTLLVDLRQRGLLEETLVLAVGEFGRTPRLNRRGGRDHWPAVWSGLIAGGGVRGGQVVGASDRDAAEPVRQPIHASRLAATIYYALGIDPATKLSQPDGTTQPLVSTPPVYELFAG